jgi:hypothetical protein
VPSCSIGFCVAITGKRSGSLCVVPATRHLALHHRLAQRRLHLRRRAVDLVGQDPVVEDRSLLEAELALAVGLVVDLRAGDVRRQQVGRELDARQPGLEVLRQALHRARLRQTGQALDPQVAVGEETDEQALDDLLLADDGGRHAALQVPEGVACCHVVILVRCPRCENPGGWSVDEHEGA